MWLDGDDLVIYDTQVRGVVARVPLNGQRLGNPIIPLEDAVYWREYDDATATMSDGRLVRYDMSAGTRARVSRADERAEARAAGPPSLVVGSADSRTRPRNSPSSTRKSVSRTSSERAAGRPSWQRRANACGSASPTGTTARRCTCSSGWTTTGSRSWLVPGVGRVPTGDLLVCRISAGRCRTVASGEQDWLLPGPFGGVGAEG